MEAEKVIAVEKVVEKVVEKLVVIEKVVVGVRVKEEATNLIKQILRMQQKYLLIHFLMIQC